MKDFKNGDIVDVRGRVSGRRSESSLVVQISLGNIYVTEDEIVKHQPAPPIFKAGDAVYLKNWQPMAQHAPQGVVIAVSGQFAWVKWPSGNMVMDLSSLELAQ